MPPAPASPSPAALPRRDLALVAAIAVACRLPSLLRAIFDDDESQYAAIAELVRAGGRLYQDGGVDFKPPGIYWTYASVFSVAGRYAMWAMHVVAIGVVVATALILAAIGARLAGRRAGVLAGVCYGVFTTVYYPKMLAANTEIFMMLCLAAMTLLVLRARTAPRWWWPLLGAGALLAVASAYKQSAVANGLVILVAAIATRRWVARLAVVGAGFAAALGAGAAVVAATSTLSGMWYWAVTKLGAHGSVAWKGDVIHNILVGLVPFVACSAIVWIGAGLALRGIRRAGVEEAALWVWAAVSVASSFASSHFYGHYFIQPLAPLSVLAGIALAPALERRGARRGIISLIALPAAVFFVFNLTFEPLTERFGAPSPDFREPVAWIRAHTQPDDRIFVWGNFSPIYVLADRVPASRFVGFMRGAERDHDAPPETAWDMGPEVWPALAADFAAHPPALIVDTATADYMSFGHYPIRRFPAVAALVDASYAPVAVVGGVTMYARLRP